RNHHRVARQRGRSQQLREHARGAQTTMSVRSAAGVSFPVTVPVAIIGAGAAGLIAGLAAREHGADVLIVERDALPAGSTALSSGLIPAAGTRWQAAKGIADSPTQFAADI